MCVHLFTVEEERDDRSNASVTSSSSPHVFLSLPTTAILEHDTLGYTNPYGNRGPSHHLAISLGSPPV